VHHEPPEVTWPLPELDVGVEVGELRPLDELLEELLELPELAEWRVLPEAELEDVPVVEAVAAPGRANASPPAAIRLAAVAETVAARSRDRPRSRAAGPGDVVWLRWLMAASVTFRSRRLLWASSQRAMRAHQLPVAKRER
jgi:hypothetical protein